MHYVYVSSLSKPEVVPSIALACNDCWQLKQHCACSTAQIGRLNGGSAGLLLVVACCFVFTLSGCGYAVSGSAMGSVLDSPGSVAFRAVRVGQTASSKVPLLNGGSAPIDISQLKVAGKTFFVNGQSNLPVTIAAGGSYRFELSFKPGNVAHFSGEFMAIDAAGNHIAQGSISGSGIDATVATWQLSAGTASVSSGNVILSYAATPVFTLASGFYNNSQMVSITDATPGARIYYTTNGTTPTTSSNVYGGPLTISSTERVQAIAVATNNSPSAVATVLYYIAAATPTFSVASGTYTSAQRVTITDTTPGAIIHYTTDGTLPGWSSPVYPGTTPIIVSSTETIKAHAVATGYTTSPEGSAKYTIIPPYAATPVFTLASGFYNNSQMVSITDATPGAGIYYTTNGTTPTTSSNVYGGPLTISSTERVQAIAVATNNSPSAVATVLYYIAAAKPTFSVASGTYTSAQRVTITDTTPGATIYFTSDGSLPGRTSAIYTSPLTVSSTETIKALAVAPGHTTSPEGVASYTILAHQVDLSWDAPGSSPDPIEGYKIYRSTGGSSTYQLLNSSIDAQTIYVDSTVQNGTAYTYYVESVDSSGVKSAPSNQVSVTIP